MRLRSRRQLEGDRVDVDGNGADTLDRGRRRRRLGRGTGLVPRRDRFGRGRGAFATATATTATTTPATAAIPEAGISLRVNDYSIDILQTGDNAVKTVRLRPIVTPRDQTTRGLEGGR